MNGRGSKADEGNSNNASGGINYSPLLGTDTAWSVNEFFCQDGIASFIDGYGVPCDLDTLGTVVDNLCGANGGCHNVVEIETAQADINEPAAQHGDSGGVVFTVSGATGNHYAAGMTDAGKNCGVNGCGIADFVWALSIYGLLGVHLNPHT